MTVLTTTSKRIGEVANASVGRLASIAVKVRIVSAAIGLAFVGTSVVTGLVIVG